MMKLFKTKLELTLSSIMLALYIIAIIIFSILYFLEIIKSPKIEPLIGGGLVSLIAVFIQFIMQYQDFKNNEKLTKSGVVKFLERRDDKDYYEKIIKTTKEKLNLLFYTGKRFSEDFCQDFDGDNAIIEALKRGVKIRLLLIDESLLPDDEKDNFRIAENNFKKIKSKYKDNFDYRYYKHIQTHNIFMNESSAIIGPYFHKKKSKYSNSIHFKSNSPYVTDFINFFETEWEECT